MVYQAQKNRIKVKKVCQGVFKAFSTPIAQGRESIDWVLGFRQNPLLW
jgi:hypothetical protein